MVWMVSSASFLRRERQSKTVARMPIKTPTESGKKPGPGLCGCPTGSLSEPAVIRTLQRIQKRLLPKSLLRKNLPLHHWAKFPEDLYNPAAREEMEIRISNKAGTPLRKSALHNPVRIYTHRAVARGPGRRAPAASAGRKIIKKIQADWQNPHKAPNSLAIPS